MTIGIIATLKVQDGKGAELEAVFAELAPAVRANEPGNKLYMLCKSRDEANTYVVMELYDDQAAIEAHRNAAHYKAAGPKLAGYLAGRPEIKFLDAV
jgi:quinol monooxygenase YgiN